MRRNKVIVVGAGMGGLTAAISLCGQGHDVTIVEAADQPGGKLSQIHVGGMGIDSGPTVFTMRWVFEELFASVGHTLSDHLTLTRADTLARHSWPDGSNFDLFTDLERSVDAVGTLAGAAEARRFRAFSERAALIYRVLEGPFMKADKPNTLKLMLDIGLHRSKDAWAIMPYRSMWDELGTYFHDPRLRQLFGRYATYCGASPFKAPATMMLIAHVEQEGVWLVEGGMKKIPEALAKLATTLGATLRCGEPVAKIEARKGRVSGVVLASGERLEADVVLCNGDPAAITTGRFGSEVASKVTAAGPGKRSLSAVTFSFTADTPADLVRHNLYFSPDYVAEFDALHAGRMPKIPTVYLCAQDRHDTDPGRAKPGPERFFAIVNAPPDGDTRAYSPQEIDLCRSRTFASMESGGLKIDPASIQMAITTPTDFERRFPATGGALYGRAGHGWDSAFRRPGARTRMPGLYLCGGATHPGAGVPMAALSGRLAAQAVMQDGASTHR
ncbi:MAG: CrtD protein [Alphaproteobacteria bacterium]|nr:MAG: CrtD protein [Alphaproteobacteria bacterium]PZO38102.1 MAG: CrtD protein [Alphaproteobacteria bacterium]